MEEGREPTVYEVDDVLGRSTGVRPARPPEGVVAVPVSPEPLRRPWTPRVPLGPTPYLSLLVGDPWGTRRGESCVNEYRDAPTTLAGGKKT